MGDRRGAAGICSRHAHPGHPRQSMVRCRSPEAPSCSKVDGVRARQWISSYQRVPSRNKPRSTEALYPLGVWTKKLDTESHLVPLVLSSKDIEVVVTVHMVLWKPLEVEDKKFVWTYSVGIMILCRTVSRCASHVPASITKAS